MNKKYQITDSGRKELEKELAELKSRRGENAEYDAAREEQGLLETRVIEIEDILQHASIIKSADATVVGLGSAVELKNSDRTVTYTVVGPVEADPMEGKISDESPIGQALMGKKVGDEVTISTPKGEIVYTISSLL